jgi:hypothetical protein
MASHGKQMTPEEKQIIVALSQQVYSSYKIAEMTGKNRRTISKFLRRRRVSLVGKCWAMTSHKLSSKMFIYFSLFKLPITGVSVPTPSAYEKQPQNMTENFVRFHLSTERKETILSIKIDVDSEKSLEKSYFQ